MRFHSTPQSALNLEITKLAIIESVAAVAFYVGIGVYFETVTHLALAVVVAPFMLLRTEISAEWGLRVSKRFVQLLSYADQWAKFPQYFFLQTRNSFASNALAAGKAPPWVSRMLGHTSPEMLFTVYGRFIPNKTRRDGNAFLARMVEDVGQPTGQNPTATRILGDLPCRTCV